jgi:hypothetical protein
MARVIDSHKLLFLFYLGCLLFPAKTFCQNLPAYHYKTITVNEVGKKIAAARGEMRQMPPIEINSKINGQQLIAQYRPYPQPKIILDEKLYDLCVGFGRDSLNALACIIGHEMAHFYENHIWSTSFSEMMGLAMQMG